MTDNRTAQEGSLCSLQKFLLLPQDSRRAAAHLRLPKATCLLARGLEGHLRTEPSTESRRLGSSIDRFLRIRWVVVLGALAVLLCPCNPGATAAEKKTILYLNSYHEGLQWSDNILKGIRSVLATEPYQLRVEYMDTKRIQDSQYLHKLYDIYAYKFKGIRFAAILSSDDNAFRFLLSHHHQLFPGTPVVFCGVDNFEESMLQGHPEFTGILEKADYGGTLRVALHLCPETKKVVVINDRLVTGQAHRAALEREIKTHFGRLDFEFIEDWTIPELSEKLSGFPPGTIVNVLSMFRNRHGRYISITECLETISKASRVPIFSSWDYLVGHGAVGGKCTSGFHQGEAAAQMVLRILSGVSPPKIPVLKESPNQYMFDYAQLARFGINPSLLPEQSIVINRPVTWYAIDRKLLWTASGLVVFLSLLLVVLALHIRYKHRAEEDLRHEVRVRAEAEEKYRGIFENAQEGIFQSTPEGLFVGANPALARIFGYGSPSQLMGTVRDISGLYVVPERREELLALLRNNKSVSEFEIEFHRRDGTKIWASVDARAIEDDDGNLMLVEGMCQDITARKCAEEALRDSEQRYRSMFEDSPISLWEEDFSQVKRYLDDLRASGVTDMRHYFRTHPDAVAHCARLVRILDVNKATLGLLEAGDKNELLAGLPRVFSKESLEVFQEELITLGEGGRQFKGEVVQRTLTGREKLVSLHLSVAPGHGESLGKVLVSLLDITERKQAEQALRELNEELEQRVSERTVELGEAMKEAEKAKETAEAANRAKSEFLANMSHELRTPLNAVLGYAQILKKQHNLTAKQKEQVGTIQTSGEHLLTLISDILDLSRIEAGKMVVEANEFDLPELIHAILSATGIKVQEKNLSLQYQEHSELPRTVRGDAKKLQQVMLNLLDNAIKYTHKGVVSLRISCFEPRTPRAGESVLPRAATDSPGDAPPSERFHRQELTRFRFEVSDSGIGIPAEKMQLIFEPFTRLDFDGRALEGIGLGLAICRRLVNLMGGSLSASSEAGVGSTFAVELDMQVAEDVEAPAGKPEKTIIGYEGPRKKLLIVDDNITNLSLLVSFLEPLGFEIHTAEDGDEAIEAAIELRPDLILLDLLMPGMDGYHALRLIRNDERLKDIKAIGVSAAVADKVLTEKFAAECNDFISKPVEADELLEGVRSQLQIRWIEEQLDETTSERPAGLSATDEREPAHVPPKDALDAIYEKTDGGDFAGIEEAIDELLREDSEYAGFCNKIRELAARYDDDAILEYINEQRTEQHERDEQ